MKWYFTPSIGNYGAAIELDEVGNVGRLAFAIISEQGLSFIKWAPLEDKMCNPKTSVDTTGMILFEALPEHIGKLNSMFGIIVPVNGKPRLIK